MQANSTNIWSESKWTDLGSVLEAVRNYPSTTKFSNEIDMSSNSDIPEHKLCLHELTNKSKRTQTAEMKDVYKYRCTPD